MERRNALDGAGQERAAELVGVMHQVQPQVADQAGVGHVEHPEQAMGPRGAQKDVAAARIAIDVEQSGAKPDEMVLVYGIDQQQMSDQLINVNADPAVGDAD